MSQKQVKNIKKIVEKKRRKILVEGIDQFILNIGAMPVIPRAKFLMKIFFQSLPNQKIRRQGNGK